MKSTIRLSGVQPDKLTQLIDEYHKNGYQLTGATLNLKQEKLELSLFRPFADPVKKWSYSLVFRMECAE